MISVIVPAYNLESCIENCLYSLLSQTYTDFELLVVNDGSTDRTAEIVRHASGKDSRIRLIAKENGGVSSARNRGIEEAKGEYVVFMDGDDICSPNLLQTLIGNMSSDIMLSRCGYCEIPSYTAKYEMDSNNKQEWDSKVYCKEILTGNAEIGLHGCLFRKALMTSLRFDTRIRHNEDKLFLYDYILNHPGKVVCSDSILYGYYQNPNSATRKGFNKSMLSLITANQEMLEHTQKVYPDLETEAKQNLQNAHLIILKAIIESGCYQQEKETFQKVKKDLFAIPAPSASLKHSLEMLSLRIGNWLFSLNIKLYRAMKG